jgi:group I intron endonuclease
MYGIIYVLTSPSGKHYVGQTTSPFSYRWSSHVSHAKHKVRSMCRHLNFALLKYGPDSFEKDIIAECLSKSELDRLERYWIGLLKSNDSNFGYNLSYGGDSHKASPETRKLMSASRKGKSFGPMSEETKLKISKAKLGHKLPPFTEEHCNKISEHNIGENHPMFGKHHSEETKEKMREAHLGKSCPWLIGKHPSDETRLKRRESMKKWWAFKKEGLSTSQII